MLNLRDGADCLDTHLKIASERVKHKPERKGSVLVSLFFSRSRRRDISEGSQVSIIASRGCSSVWEIWEKPGALDGWGKAAVRTCSTLGMLQAWRCPGSRCLLWLIRDVALVTILPLLLLSNPPVKVPVWQNVYRSSAFT